MKIINEESSEDEKRSFFSSHPQKLYKYRVWSNALHKKVLTESELFFSSPKNFNDPYDCGLPFRQHADNSDPVIIAQALEKSVPGLFPHLNAKELEEKCVQQLSLIMQNPESWFEMNWGYKPEDLSQLFGVLSLTPHPANYLMWSHYSNSHTGFCVEFDTRKLFESLKGEFQMVRYSDEIPILSINDTLENKLLDILIYTKSKIWEYEDEYRLTLINGPNKTLKFDPHALTAIYFGCKTQFEDMYEIIDIVSKKYPHANFKKLELHKEEFKLTEGNLTLL